MKKLKRSRSDRMIAGVLGGMAKHYQMDASLLRIMTVIFMVITGFLPFIVVYLVMWLIIPSE